MALSADVRRVITTIDRNDKAVVLFDGATPHKKVRPQTGTVSRLLWVTDQTPADLSGTATIFIIFFCSRWTAVLEKTTSMKLLFFYVSMR